MTLDLRLWATRAAPDAGFASAWEARLARLPMANYSMRLDYLRWEAEQGRHARLVLADEGERRAALVLREDGGELHCGWPWRWQSALEQPDPRFLPGLSPADAAWLFLQAHACAGDLRLRAFLPAATHAGLAGFRAGATICQAIDREDAELLAAMGASKRRHYRRALGEGFEVRAAGAVEEFAAFRQLERCAMRLREDDGPVKDDPPAPGHGYREWELPWMQLIVALKDGEVVAGVGDGVIPGGMVEGRAAAVSVEMRRLGVMALLSHAEARWLRDRGHRWFNHGGDTMFKREVAGTLGRRLEMFCWLGGGARWSGLNRAEALLRRARPRVAGWVRAVGRRFDRRAR